MARYSQPSAAGMYVISATQARFSVSARTPGSADWAQAWYVGVAVGKLRAYADGGWVCTAGARSEGSALQPCRLGRVAGFTVYVDWPDYLRKPGCEVSVSLNGDVLVGSLSGPELTEVREWLGSPAAVILVGAPLLRQRLRLLPLAALAQRVTASYHLVGLTAAETAAYIALQLGLDGTPAVTFTPAAVEDVFHVTRGVPRLINRLCQTALLAATSNQLPVVEPRTVKAAAMDCGLA